MMMDIALCSYQYGRQEHEGDCKHHGRATRHFAMLGLLELQAFTRMVLAVLQQKARALPVYG